MQYKLNKKPQSLYMFIFHQYTKTNESTCINKMSFGMWSVTDISVKVTLTKHSTAVS